MSHPDVGTTNPSKLRMLSDWGNHSAWVEFQSRYDPHLRRCCTRLGLTGEAADDACQETWIEVAKRLKSFVYDPRGSFRGWLWRVYHHEALDLLERKRSEQAYSLDERDEYVLLARHSADFEVFTEAGEDRPIAPCDDASRGLARLFREAEEIQAAVRRRVEPHTWDAFWLVKVALWSVDETAQHLHMRSERGTEAKEGRVRFWHFSSTALS
jgi:RNA polymerase sigma factor (sigma-70 family)